MDFTEIYKSLNQFKKYNEEFNINAKEIEEVKKSLANITNIKIDKINCIDKGLEKEKLFIYKGLIIDYNTQNSFNEYKKVLEKFLIDINEEYQKKLEEKKQDFFKLELSKIINFKILRENINKYFIENILNKETINKDEILNDIINDIYLVDTFKNSEFALNKYYKTNGDESLFLSFSFKENYIGYITNLISFIQKVINKINENKIQTISSFNTNKDKLQRIESKIGEITSSFYIEKPQVGGSNDEINKLRTKLRTVNLFLLDLIQEYNIIQKVIVDYNRNLYEIYYFLLFMYNEDKNRTYSLFSIKYISKKFIEEYLKYYKKIKHIDKFNLINDIINSYLSRSETDKYIMTNNKEKLNFILLLDKFNTYLRQYIEQKELVYENISFNLENIFFIGNRDLQNLTVIYTGNGININELVLYFYLSNMYLIKSIKINNKELIKYSDIKNLSLESNIIIIINNKYTYNFTNVKPLISDKIIEIKFL